MTESERGGSGRSPQIIGRYEVLREIGRGGMAIVYVARQPDLDRQVALKELSRFHAGSVEYAHRFLRESRLAGSLNHPNIVTVHEYFEHNTIPYIAMEYVPRGSLRPYMKRLTLSQIAGVLEGVLAGLAHGEAAGIVHRDLKPENIMVTSDGRMKITDFGIARATQRAATQYVTATGMTVGTPTYMAPEQAMAGDIGPWSDLYSVGVMTYELVVGRVPFHDTEAPMAILMRHVSEGIPSAIEVQPDVDPQLSAWIDSLLVKDPQKRVHHALDAWESLEEIIVGLLGPLWRRNARLLEDQRAVEQALPLTPAPFESQPSIRTPTPGSSQAVQGQDEFVTFAPGRPLGQPVAPPVTPAEALPVPGGPPAAATPATTPPPTPTPAPHATPGSTPPVTPVTPAEQPTPAPEQPTPAPEQPTPAAEQPTPAAEQPTAEPTGTRTPAAEAALTDAAALAAAAAAAAAGAGVAERAETEPAPDFVTYNPSPAAPEPSVPPPASEAPPEAVAPPEPEPHVPAEAPVLADSEPEPEAQPGIQSHAPLHQVREPEPSPETETETDAETGTEEEHELRPEPASEPAVAPPVPEPVAATAAPAARRSGHGGRAAFAALAAAALVVGAAVGFLIAPSSSNTATRPPAPLSQTASAGPLKISFPSDWARSGEVPSAAASLKLTNAVTLTPRRSAPGGALVLGSTSAAPPDLLPASFITALGTTPPGATVTLGPHTFKRYLKLVPQNTTTAVSVYALPTVNTGTVIAACMLPTSSADAFNAACERLLSSLRLSGPQLPLTSSPAYAAALSAAIAKLGHARGSAGAQLTQAKLPSGQASAARALSNAYQEAAGTVTKLQPGPAVAATNAAIAAALRQAAGAYRALSAAAAHDNKGAYKAAESQIAGADKALKATFAQLRNDGYELG